jgi:hypothetical protein
MFLQVPRQSHRATVLLNLHPHFDVGEIEEGFLVAPLSTVEHETIGLHYPPLAPQTLLREMVRSVAGQALWPFRRGVDNEDVMRVAREVSLRAFADLPLLVEALHLHRSAYVLPLPFELQSEHAVPDIGQRPAPTITYRRNEPYPWPANVAIYELTEADLPAVRSWYDRLKRAERLGTRSPLKTALRHLGQAFRRDNAEDKLIDLAIALESTTLAGSQGDLSFRLSLRCASLLSGQRSPAATHALAAALYRARNAIVHRAGTVSDMSGERWMKEAVGAQGVGTESFTRLCEDLVRSVLGTYVSHASEGESRDVINNRLETQIVNALARHETPETDEP